MTEGKVIAGILAAVFVTAGLMTASADEFRLPFNPEALKKSWTVVQYQISDQNKPQVLVSWRLFKSGLLEPRR